MTVNTNANAREGDDRRRADDAEKSRREAEASGEEGRRGDRLQHFKNLIAAEGVVMPDRLRDELVERIAQWNSSFRPANVWECWLLEFVARVTLDVERYDLMLRTRTALLAQRADSKTIWNIDRRAEIARKAENFESEWVALVPELRKSAAGVEWLLKLWEELRQAFGVRGTLSDRQRLLAFKLQGRPVEAMQSDRVQNGTASPEEIRTLFDREIGELRKALADGLSAVDEIERLAVVSGASLDDSAETKSIRRLRSQAVAHLKWANSLFKQGRLDHDPSPKSRSKPSGAGPARPFDSSSNSAAAAEPAVSVVPAINPACAVRASVDPSPVAEPADSSLFAQVPVSESFAEAKAEGFLSKAARRLLESSRSAFSSASKTSASSAPTSRKPLSAEERQAARAFRKRRIAKGRLASA